MLWFPLIFPKFRSIVLCCLGVYIVGLMHRLHNIKSHPWIWSFLTFSWGVFIKRKVSVNNFHFCQCSENGRHSTMTASSFQSSCYRMEKYRFLLWVWNTHRRRSNSPVDNIPLSQQYRDRWQKPLSLTWINFNPQHELHAESIMVWNYSSIPKH